MRGKAKAEKEKVEKDLDTKARVKATKVDIVITTTDLQEKAWAKV